MWKWFQAYLSCHSQHVRLNQCISDPLPVISGVPQGSILGPLLFLIFVNDIPSSIKHSHVFLFADDAKCLKKMSSSSDCHSLQDDLSRLSIWSLWWNLHFNENKCVVLRFCSKLPRVLFDYTINNTAIQVFNCHRDLGILVSSDLTILCSLPLLEYKVPGLIRHSVSSSLDIRAKKTLYLLLV